MRFSLFSLIAIATASLVSATAAGQFKLGVTKHPSRCFLECHHQVVNFFNLPGQPSNDPVAYGPNCRMAEWNRMITQCLVLGCQSPPDLAYAIEYATSICGRAGVNVQLELPEEYLDTVDGAYFRSDLYLRSNDAPRPGLSTGALGTAVAIGVVGAALI